MPGACNQDFLACGEQISDGRLPGTVPVGSVQKDIGVTGAKQALQPRFAGGDGLVQSWVTQIHGLPAQGVLNGLRHMRRSRRVEKSIAGDALVGVAVCHKGFRWKLP